VEGFGYLLEVYLGLVVCYPILVRVSGLSFGYLLFYEISLGVVEF
jgi:membrane-bound acyltransferase YfiQ involved in biofilm formation